MLPLPVPGVAPPPKLEPPLAPEPMPVLPAPAELPLVPVAACSCRHFVRSSPVSVSHRPLLDPVEAAPLLAPTLVSDEVLERGAVVPAEPAASPLVPVDGAVVVPVVALPLVPAP